MRPPKRNRKPPARGASAAKVPRTSKRQKSKSTGPVVPGPSSSGQFQAEGDLAIPGPSRLLQPQPGPSSSRQIQTSLDSATPGVSGLIPSKPRTSSATFTIWTIAFSGKPSSSHRFNVNRPKLTRHDNPPPGGIRQLPWKSWRSWSQSNYCPWISSPEQLWYVSLPSNPITFYFFAKGVLFFWCLSTC